MIFWELVRISCASSFDINVVSMLTGVQIEVRLQWDHIRKEFSEYVFYRTKIAIVNGITMRLLLLI